MTGVTILGATGSIGLNTLDVIARHRERYQVIALSAHRDVDGLLRLCREWDPPYAVMADAACAARLQAELRAYGARTQVLAGEEGLITIAGLPESDIVMAAIVGAAGLLPTLAAARAGKRVLLANKEVLVMAGQLFMETVRGHGAELLPIDSEHNAVFQCLPPGSLPGRTPPGVSRILLTASGGPFRKTPLAELASVTPEQALAHPNWVMGRKISVDSATMMNKGLEIIEASWLFNLGPEQIEVVLHPQSVIHSLVEYLDGSVLAQLGNPDMRTPIAHALAWPERIAAGVKRLDLFTVARLDFERPDFERFPCLRLATDTLRAGGTAAAVLNAANEVAVAEFLAGRIRFTDIARVIESALSRVSARPATDLEAVLAADTAARAIARQAIRERAA